MKILKENNNQKIRFTLNDNEIDNSVQVMRYDDSGFEIGPEGDFSDEIWLGGMGLYYKNLEGENI